MIATALLLGPSDAAARLGVGRTSLYGLIRDGTLHPIHVGRRTVLHIAEIDDLARRWAQEAGVSADVLASDGPDR